MLSAGFSRTSPDMKKALIAGAGVMVLAAAGAGGYLHLQRRADALLVGHLARIDSVLPAGYTLTHGGAEADLFDTGGTLRDVVLAGAGGTVTIREVRFSGVGATQAGRVELDTIRAAGGALALTSDTVTIEDLDLTAAVMAVATAGTQEGVPIDRVRFARLTASNLLARDDEVELGAGRIVLAGYGPGAPTRVEAEELSLRDPAPSGNGSDMVTAGMAVVDGYDVATALGAVLRGAEPPPPAGLKEIAVDRIVLSQAGTTVASADRLAATWDVAGRAGRSATLAVRGFDMPVTEEMIRDGGGFFEEGGYERLGGDLDAAVAYDTGTGVARIGPVSLVGRDMGVMEATVVLADAPDPLAVGEPDLDAWMRSKVAGIELSYTDHSLMRRAMAAAAAEQGLTQAELVEAGVAQIDALLSGGEAPDGAQREMLAAVQAFLKSPGTIELTAAPAEPVEVPTLVIALMMAPAEALDLLGVRVTAR
jgi:hypothetical protein